MTNEYYKMFNKLGFVDVGLTEIDFRYKIKDGYVVEVHENLDHIGLYLNSIEENESHYFIKFELNPSNPELIKIESAIRIALEKDE